MFILSAERDADSGGEVWSRYEQYLEQNRGRFPESAYQLATSSWYFDFHDPRCPHDAWLEEASIIESGLGERQESRSVAIKLRLLGAYHNGAIELYYPRVFRYALSSSATDVGHNDWRYDECRVADDGHLIHEIEWWGRGEVARWVIEASDVQFSRHPHVGK